MCLTRVYGAIRGCLWENVGIGGRKPKQKRHLRKRVWMDGLGLEYCMDVVREVW